MTTNNLLKAVKEDQSILTVVKAEAPLKVVNVPDSIFIRTNRKYVRLLFDQVLYIESLRNYVRIITLTRQYLVLVKLGTIENLLPPSQFCRIHRSYIVSLSKVKEFDHSSVYVHNAKLPIGKNYRKLLKGKFITTK